jgi:hypothetical protein
MAGGRHFLVVNQWFDGALKFLVKIKFTMTRRFEASRTDVPNRPWRAGAVAASLAGHGLILALVLTARPGLVKSPIEAGPEPIALELVDMRSLMPAATPSPTPTVTPTPAKAPARSAAARSPAKPERASLASNGPTIDDLAAAAGVGDGLSDAQLAGAATGESGPTGGACDMARWLQGALRKDPLVRTAVAGLGDKAVMVWDGDWVRRPGEDGKGLAAVREALTWEIAFSPRACRGEQVRGLVVLSMNPGQGGPRLAMGSGVWRWSDLLTTRTAELDGAGPGQTDP